MFASVYVIAELAVVGVVVTHDTVKLIRILAKAKSGYGKYYIVQDD
jgi:hypothetical protein